MRARRKRNRFQRRRRRSTARRDRAARSGVFLSVGGGKFGDALFDFDRPFFNGGGAGAPSSFLKVFDRFENELLRLGARNQRSGVDRKVERIKFLLTDQIGDGLAQRSSADQLAKDAALFFRRFFVVRDEQIETRPTGRVTEQNFSVELGGFNPSLLKKGFRPGQQSAVRPLFRLRHDTSFGRRLKRRRRARWTSRRV